MICCGFVHNFCRISLVISLSTQYLGLSTGYYVSFFLYFSMKAHLSTIYTFGAKIISLYLLLLLFVEKFSNSCL